MTSTGAIAGLESGEVLVWRVADGGLRRVPMFACAEVWRASTPRWGAKGFDDGCFEIQVFHASRWDGLYGRPGEHWRLRTSPPGRGLHECPSGVALASRRGDGLEVRDRPGCSASCRDQPVSSLRRACSGTR